MQIICSYNPYANLPVLALQGELQELEDPLRGLFRARPYFSEPGGVFVRFLWADWPESLSASLKEKVEVFLSQHPDLQPIDEGPGGSALFGGKPDPVAAAEIGRRLHAHFGDRVAWVVAERDSRGRIVANCFIEGAGEILWRLSWRRTEADPQHPRLESRDMQQLNAAIGDVARWAASRIQPILDTLKQKMQELYGERFRGLYVYGSYARPDAGIELPMDSDLDVAVVLTDFENAYDEMARFGGITSELSLENDIVVSVVPIRESDYNEGCTNFIRVISEYAIPVK